MKSESKKIIGRALILPGAVAKGAYEAGVISVIAEREIQIDRVIATSSGALNAVAYCAGIRVGQEKEVAKRLVNSWIKFGSWHDSFHFNFTSWLSGKGMSDRSSLLHLLRELVPPAGDKAINDFELRIIVASLDGIRGSIGDTPSTTYEKVLEFSGEDFDTAESLERVFEATTAACSFPGLFTPANIKGLGLCFDGGAVNNAPIQYALDDHDIKEIVMAIPFPILVPPPVSLHGIDLLNHSVEILINERLYRDLKNADDRSHKAQKLDELAVLGILSDEQLAAVRAIVPFRKIQITQIRPDEAIGGGVFSGFMDQKFREKFIEEGQKAARKTFNLVAGHSSRTV